MKYKIIPADWTWIRHKYKGEPWFEFLGEEHQHYYSWRIWLMNYQFIVDWKLKTPRTFEQEETTPTNWMGKINRFTFRHGLEDISSWSCNRADIY